MKLEKLAPAFQDYLWGGTKLRDVYGKRCDFDKVAESWELSTHPAGESTLAGGERDGLPLGQYFQQFPQALGKNAAAFESFPVLIKLIDAKEPLSIQVHPSDAYALRVEGEYGKTEMWVGDGLRPRRLLVLWGKPAGEPGGVPASASRERHGDRRCWTKVEVHPGDVFFIQSGTIHAIGAGILICEIQQNSNCTYRVYDYDRRGADGKPRPLHIDKALDVCTLEPSDTASHLGPVLSCAGGHRPKAGGVRLFLHPEAAGGGGPHLRGRGGKLPLLGVRRGRRAAVRAGEHPGIHGGGEPAGARGHGEGVPAR